MSYSGDNSIVPQGENRCIWMDAGLVSYKLCDRQFACDNCPFDAGYRSQYHPSESTGTSPVPRVDPVNGLAAPGDAEAYFEQKLDQLLLPFTKVRLPDDRFYTREHFWIKEDSGNVYRVGVDHLAVTLLSSVAGIVFTKTPSYIDRGAPCLWIVHPDGALSLNSPMSGTMLYANRSVSNAPYLMLNFPYTDGWLVSISPDTIGGNDRGMMDPDDAAEHYAQQGQVLRVAFRESFKKMQHNAGFALADGGTQLQSIPQILGLGKYFELIHKFYYAP